MSGISTRRRPPKNEMVPAASTISSTRGVGPSSTVVSGSSSFSTFRAFWAAVWTNASSAA